MIGAEPSSNRGRAKARRGAAALGLFLATLAGDASATSTPGVERSDRAVPGTDVRAGVSRTKVSASIDEVRTVVTDFGRYADFIDRFKRSRVVGKSGKAVDAYLEVPILNGMSKIWAVVRFQPPKTDDGVEVVSGRMVKGNVKRLDATWRLRQLPDGQTEVELELLILPGFSLIDSMLTQELRYASAKAVYGARREVQRRRGP